MMSRTSSTVSKSHSTANEPSKNATKHGVLAEDMLLPNEDRFGFERLRTEITQELHPTTAVERILVDTIVSASWRLRRLYRFEAAVLTTAILTANENAARERAALYEVDEHAEIARTLSTRISNSKSHDEACCDARSAIEARSAPVPTLGSAVAASMETLAVLPRYESNLVINMRRALRELEGLRRGANS